jgi:hypothetical protein
MDIIKLIPETGLNPRHFSSAKDFISILELKLFHLILQKEGIEKATKFKIGKTNGLEIEKLWETAKGL